MEKIGERILGQGRETGRSPSVKIAVRVQCGMTVELIRLEKSLVGWVRESRSEEEGRGLISHMRWWEWLSLGKLPVTQGSVTQGALTSICPLCSAMSTPTGSWMPPRRLVQRCGEKKFFCSSSIMCLFFNFTYPRQHVEIRQKVSMLGSSLSLVQSIIVP